MRGLPVALEAPRFAAVTGLHLDVQQQRIGVGLVAAQLRDPLGGLVVLDLAVPQPQVTSIAG